MRYAELVRKLRRLGFEQDRQAKGAHEVWWLAGTDRSTIVPNHRKDISKRLLHSILRDLGLTEADLDGK